MTAKHEPHATPEVKQDSGVDQAPEASTDLGAERAADPARGTERRPGRGG